MFERTLSFLNESVVDLAAANILTPFPGTLLHARLECAGRIIDRDLTKYDMNHVVFNPMNMSPGLLKQGPSWVRAEFYSRRRITRRVFRAFGYLDADTIVNVLIPINAGFHSKLMRGPTKGHADAFEFARRPSNSL